MKLGLGGALLVGLMLLTALVASALVLRRRAVYLLGRRAAPLAGTILLTIWLAGLSLGQITGSLLGMTALAALPLLAVAVAARRWTRPRRLAFPAWTRIDWWVFRLTAGVVLINSNFDSHCHRAVSGAFLRGNIPPTALNDPRFALPYHSLFDAIVATLVRALPADTELALDLVTIGCVALTMTNLLVLGRFVFRTALANQVGRVLFFVGFGPTFLRLFSNPDLERLHGQSSQAFIDIILRRPTALGFVLLTGVAAVLAPRYLWRPPARQALTATSPHPGWLLPSLFVLPLLAEEMIVHIGVLVLPLLLMRRLPIRWVVAGLALFAFTVLRSGVFAAALGAATPMAAPKLALAWPPTLPTWAVARDGIPLLSWASGGALFCEFGPFVLATLILVAIKGTAVQRILMAPLLMGLLVATFLRLNGWDKSDMDRFLFYGSPFAFMLVALWLERDAVTRPRSKRGKPSNLGRPAGVVLAGGMVVLMATMPTLFAVWTSWKNARGWNNYWRDEPGATLRERLRAVGSRDPILTDRNRAYDLVQAGFVVLGPMNSTSVGKVDEDHLDDYLKTNADRAAWYYLPKSDDRMKGLPIEAELDDHALARAPTVNARAAP